MEHKLSQVLFEWTVTPICESCQSYTFSASLLVRAVLLFNIIKALLPLIRRIRKKDDLVDIPLTPSQRSLLGLDPQATPSTTPDTQYVTPPRYPRSSTPRSGTPGSRGSSPAASPLSRNGSPSIPQSPSVNALRQKTIASSKEPRRYSYGMPSPLGQGSGNDISVFVPPSTPSPSGRGAGVPLNSRWLYERGRTSSGSRSIF